MKPQVRVDERDGSIWVGLVLPDAVAEELEPLKVGTQRDGDVGPHITLAYYRGDGQFDGAQALRVVEALRRVRREPIDFAFTGAGKFEASPQSDGLVPVLLFPSGMGLTDLRQDVVAALDSAGVDGRGAFDFVPHVNVGYVDDPDPDLPKVPSVRWTQDEMTVTAPPSLKVSLSFAPRADTFDPPASRATTRMKHPVAGVWAPQDPGGGAGDRPMKKLDIISKTSGGQFELKSHTGKVLGGPYSEEEARSQETAINIAKARAAGHHIAKPDDLRAYADEVESKQNVGDPDEAEGGIPKRVGNKWVIEKNGEVAGEYDTEKESLHLEKGFALNSLFAAQTETGSEAAQVGSEPDVTEPFRKDCKRYDVGEVGKPVITREGWLKADGFFTRTGIFNYKNKDGSVRKELRLEGDVFHPAALESFSMLPITDTHPPEFLNSDNVSEYQRGQVGENITKDGDYVRGKMLVTNKDLVQKLVGRKMDEISCGYTCDVDETPGVWNGEPYDAIQKNIRGNHIAIVPKGRAGPGARVHMDSGASVMLSINSPGSDRRPTREGSSVPRTVKVDGKDYEYGSDEHHKALDAYASKVQATHDSLTRLENDRRDEHRQHLADVQKMKDDIEAMKAKSDAAEERAKKLESEKKDAATSAVESYRARQSLERDARIVLGRKEKLDGLSDKEIKVRVLRAAEPELELKGKTDAYVDARFDIAIEQAIEDREDGGGSAGARRVVVDEDEVETADGEHADDDMTLEERIDAMPIEEANKPHTDSATAYMAMVKRHRTAWTQPLAPARRDVAQAQ